MTQLKTIDLFAGIGGIRKGFENTGRFSTVYANDFEKNCKLTYDKNFDGTKLTIQDIRNVSIKNDKIPKFDFVLSGFPCQPFSQGGLKQGFSDHKGRGVLFEEIVRLLRESKEEHGEYPMGFLLENVKNLKTHDNGKTYQIIYDRLAELGYSIDSKVYNSLDFGVAQSRERIYMVGFRDQDKFNSFVWPEATTSPDEYVKVTDILEPQVEARFYYNGKPLYEKICNEVTNPNYVYNYRRTYVRAIKSGYSPTLVASMGMGGHNVPIIRDAKGIRRLTPTECARLQGFDDLHIPLGVSEQQIYKQIGNSVSIPVIQAIAGNIAKAMETAVVETEKQFEPINLGIFVTKAA